MLRKTILIIEDEPLIAMNLEDLVNELGHAARSARSVEEAVRVVEGGGIDLAILDYTIRDRDSEPVALALRQRQTPFIVCSGSRPGSLSKAIDGAPFLSKPYAEADLLAAIQSALAGA